MPDIDQEQITDWLEEFGFKWELVEQPEARFNIAFEYPSEGGGYTHVASLAPHSVLVMRAISVAKEHRQSLTELGIDGYAGRWDYPAWQSRGERSVCLGSQSCRENLNVRTNVHSLLRLLRRTLGNFLAHFST